MLAHKIDPGMLDCRIGILAPTETNEDAGSVAESFTLAKTVFGMVRYPVAGQHESLMSGKITAVRATSVTIRNYSGLNEQYRLRINSQDYDILAISYLGRNEFMVIDCERRL